MFAVNCRLTGPWRREASGMKRLFRDKNLHGLLGKSQFLLFSGSAFASALLEARVDDIKDRLGEQLGNQIVFLQQNCWWIVPILLVMAGIIEGLRRYIGEPLQWKSIQAALEAIDKNVFKEYMNSTDCYHRVTLFRRDFFHPCIRIYPFYFRLAWPWSGWMVPVARSGHTYQQMLSIFMAPDNAQKAEGVAGKAWACKATIEVHDLPDVSQNHSKEDENLYETRTFFPLNQYLRKQIRARSFYGIPVYVDGEPWGAIVIDSSLPSIAKGRVVKVTSYYLPILDRLLKNF